MILKQTVLTLLVVFSGSVFCFTQTVPKPKALPISDPSANLQTIRSSPAYAEVLLRKAELDSNLQSLLVDYNEEYPKVKEIRFELGLIKKETDRLLAVKPADASKLSQALGKLILRKIELEVELNNLQQQYKDEHPDVRKAKKKVEIFENAIKEVLG